MATISAPPWRTAPAWAHAIRRGARVVTITENEAYLVEALGALRNAAGEDKGWAHAGGISADKGTRAHELGALGEYAVCQVFRRKWNPSIGVRGRYDVGPLQVRANSWQPGGLILRPGGKDRPEDAFVLVDVSISPTFLVHGWQWGREVMVEARVSRPDPTRPPCWVMPQEALRPLDELVGIFPELRLAPR